jgi:hypothetical protein
VAHVDGVLKDVFAAISPGGLLVVAEMDSPSRFLPDNISMGRPGLESRCHDALEQEQAIGNRSTRTGVRTWSRADSRLSPGGLHHRPRVTGPDLHRPLCPGACEDKWTGFGAFLQGSQGCLAFGP